MRLLLSEFNARRTGRGEQQRGQVKYIQAIRKTLQVAYNNIYKNFN